MNLVHIYFVLDQRTLGAMARAAAGLDAGFSPVFVAAVTLGLDLGFTPVFVAAMAPGLDLGFSPVFVAAVALGLDLGFPVFVGSFFPPTWFNKATE